MKTTIIFDENNYVKILDANDNGEYDIDYDSFDVKHKECYYLKDGKLKFDKEKAKSQDEKENNQLIIQELKNELNSTDFMVIKSYEYYLAGLEIPYDFVKLYKQRQELRDKINELEN